MNEQVPQRNPETEASPPHPSIYVADLAAYNDGRLHGAWLDAAREPAAIHADIAALLAASPIPGAEEFAIHDTDGFGACQIHEYDSIELVGEIARGITRHGAAFAAWADVNEGSPERFSDFTDTYLGHFPSLAAYAEQLMDDLGIEQQLDETVDERLRAYVRIDCDQLARDMVAGGDLYEYPAHDGGVWLFTE